MKISTIILAAGQGTRMVSDLPKVLHPLNGKPLILYAVETAHRHGHRKTGGCHRQRRRAGARNRWRQGNVCLAGKTPGNCSCGIAAESAYKDYDGLILVVAADMPLLTRQTLQKMVDDQLSTDSPMTMLTVRSGDSHGFGRILRGKDGEVRAIIEEAHANSEELKIDELNVGAYCFKSSWMWEVLKRIKLSPKGEYYLTDLVGVAVTERKNVTNDSTFR